MLARAETLAEEHLFDEAIGEFYARAAARGRNRRRSSFRCAS